MTYHPYELCERLPVRAPPSTHQNSLYAPFRTAFYLSPEFSSFAFSASFFFLSASYFSPQ